MPGRVMEEEVAGAFPRHLPISRIRHVTVLFRFLNSRAFFWALLALPSVPMIAGLAGGADPESLLHPSGEFSARLLIVALVITPLTMMFPKARWPRWLMRRRRALGVAAFGYAALHTIFYVVEMETLRNMLAEFWALGIWTGWAAFAIFVPLALTSNNVSQRLLGRRWKQLQRWVYAAAVFTLIHWIFIHNELGAAIVHFAPLAVLEAYRIARIFSATGGIPRLGSSST